MLLTKVSQNPIKYVEEVANCHKERNREKEISKAISIVY